MSLFSLLIGVILVVISIWLWNRASARHLLVKIFAIIVGIVGLYLFVVGLLSL